jgi:DNA polymerase-3 subunit alpha (Gram-positive type)
LYGAELDLQNEKVAIVKNPINQNLDNAEYVIFDIETTGLFNEYDEIIEFGAIKVKNSTIVDSIDFFIKPSKPLPAKIKELTHISDSMLENQIGIKEGLKKIID